MERKERGEVKRHWPSPSIPGRPRRSVCERRAREDSERATRMTTGRRRRGGARWPRAAVWRGPSGM